MSPVDEWRRSSGARLVAWRASSQPPWSRRRSVESRSSLRLISWELNSAILSVAPLIKIFFFLCHLTRYNDPVSLAVCPEYTE